VVALAESFESGNAEPRAGSLGEAVQISVSWQKARSEPQFQPLGMGPTWCSG
jgi:hypothetical protein